MKHHHCKVPRNIQGILPWTDFTRSKFTYCYRWRDSRDREPSDFFAFVVAPRGAATTCQLTARACARVHARESKRTVEEHDRDQLAPNTAYI